ncbi:hypothetical protein VNO80_25535 [Phaseolus coccineus]|uniref:Uncharacterized protein n=1 Tax=Phaseolus coccineus TaxID=3886 RepID=A0AAN9LUE4_PHACN
MMRSCSTTIWGRWHMRSTAAAATIVASNSFMSSSSPSSTASSTFAFDADDSSSSDVKIVPQKILKMKLCILISGSMVHTAAIYTTREELKLVLFEGWMANGVAPVGQLTTTTYFENFLRFPIGILGIELIMEAMTTVDFFERPLRIFTNSLGLL